MDCTFDDGTLPANLVAQGCCSYSQVFEGDTTRFGYGLGYHFHLNQKDPKSHNGKRTELSASRYTRTEAWYGYSFFIPHTYVSDTVREIVTQFHNVLPDTTKTGVSTVPIALQIRSDHYYLQIQWSAENDGITHDGTISEDLGPVDKDKWIDWVWHIKWSFNGAGIVQLWKNGVKIYDRVGPNCYNDGKNPYFKCGEYKHEWQHVYTKGITQRDIYFDNVRIADAGGNYNSVAPYIDTPFISNVSPRFAVAGKTVTLTGVYFTGVTAVNIGGQPAQSYTVIDSKTIQAVVAPNAIQNYVAVTAHGVTDTLYGFFTQVKGSITASKNVTCLNDDPKPQIAFKGIGGYTPYTFIYTVNGGDKQTISTSDTASNPTIFLKVADSVQGAYVYSLLKVTDKFGNTRDLDTSLTISVNTPPPPSTTNLTICTSQLPFVWNGFTYKEQGTHTITLTSAAGCDSTATLVLTVKGGGTSNTAISVTPDELPYTWNNINIIKSGTYTDTIPTAKCDSIATLVLTVVGGTPGDTTLLLKVYPNPAAQNFHLSITNGDANNKVILTVVDLLGRQVYNTSGDVGSIYSFGDKFSAGVYIVKVANGKLARNVRVIKRE